MTDKAAEIKAFQQAASAITKKQKGPTKPAMSLKTALGIDRPLYMFKNHQGEELGIYLRKPGLIEISELLESYEPLARNMSASSEDLNKFLDVFFGFVIDQSVSPITLQDCRKFFRHATETEYGQYLHMFMTGVPFDPKQV